MTDSNSTTNVDQKRRETWSVVNRYVWLLLLVIPFGTSVWFLNKLADHGRDVQSVTLASLDEESRKKIASDIEKLVNQSLQKEIKQIASQVRLKYEAERNKPVGAESVTYWETAVLLENIKRLEALETKNTDLDKQLDKKADSDSINSRLSDYGSSIQYVGMLASMLGVIITGVILFFSFESNRKVDEAIEKTDESIDRKLHEPIKKFEKETATYLEKIDTATKEVNTATKDANTATNAANTAAGIASKAVEDANNKVNEAIITIDGSIDTKLDRRLTDFDTDAKPILDESRHLLENLNYHNRSLQRLKEELISAAIDRNKFLLTVNKVIEQFREKFPDISFDDLHSLINTYEPLPVPEQPPPAEIQSDDTGEASDSNGS
jgi:hypothetical protein